jgi:hypothetical protein
VLDALVTSGGNVELAGGRIVNLAGLLDPSIRVLRLVDVTKLGSLEGIDSAPSLRQLDIVNAPHIRSLGPLAALTELRRLRIAISMSRTSNQNVDSLSPLAALRHLEALRMTGVIAADRRLRPLHGLGQLRDVSIPNFYSVEEFGRLAGALPDATGFGLKPVIEEHPGRCRRCGEQSEVQLIGRKRNRFVCVHCDAEAVARHRAMFEHWRRAQAEEKEPSAP